MGDVLQLHQRGILCKVKREQDRVSDIQGLAREDGLCLVGLEAA